MSATDQGAEPRMTFVSPLAVALASDKLRQLLPNEPSTTFRDRSVLWKHHMPRPETLERLNRSLDKLDGK
jgi:hypothetical protein